MYKVSEKDAGKTHSKTAIRQDGGQNRLSNCGNEKNHN